MLYITTSGGMEFTWHTGSPIPVQAEKDRIVTFQADGHELDMIFRAMRKTGTAEGFDQLIKREDQTGLGQSK